MYDPPIPKQFLEDTLLKLLLDNIQKGDHVYDVGAARGDYTLCLAVSGCTISCFEPNPNTFNSLIENINLNKLTNIQCFNFGLSNYLGTLPFYLVQPALRSSFNLDMLESENEKIIRTLDVNVFTIDVLVNKKTIPPPDHIKIDVEGFELEVLTGAEKTISKCRPMIYLELHGKDTQYIKKIGNFFKNINYDVEKYGTHARIWVCPPRNYIGSTF